MAGPYPVDTLNAPLSPTQRTAIIAFFKTPAGKSKTQDQIANYIEGSTSGGQNIGANSNTTVAFYIASGKNSHNEQMDSAIITAYNNVLKGGDFTAPSPGDIKTTISNPLEGVAAAVNAVLSTLTNANFWKRTAEFGVGVVLIGVAVAGTVKRFNQ